MIRRILTGAGALISAVMLTFALGGVASAETGGVIRWNTSLGAGFQQLVNHNLYVIDETDSRFPVHTSVDQWRTRTGAPVFWRDGFDPTSYDCSAVHCSWIRQQNLGAIGWRVRMTNNDGDPNSRTSAVIKINMGYAWDLSPSTTLNQSGACQAVAKATFADYTRSATDYKSCLSSAMRWTIGNTLDDGYLRNVVR